jgi:hypothetical protein
MSLPIEGWTYMVRRGGRTEHEEEGLDQPASNVRSHVPANLPEATTSKEEMKNAGGDRPDPYQLG